MAETKNTTPSRLASALEATNNLTTQGLNNIFSGGYAAARAAHTEIVVRPVIQKRNAFYNHFLRLVSELVALFTENYRRYFRLALAHPHQAGSDPDEWAWKQLQPTLYKTFDWIRDWYILACDGENRYVKHVESTEFVPGQTVSLSIPLSMSPAPPPESWCAPAWLFQIGFHVGIGPLKDRHVPATDSEDKLSSAHTRLLLKGSRRIFLMASGIAIENVRNEETAAAAAVPTEAPKTQTPRINKRIGWQKKLKLYKAIQKILKRSPKAQGIDFCAELDKHHAPPLHDWTKRKEWREGLTWKEAWAIPGLRRKIRRVRQEAMKSL